MAIILCAMTAHRYVNYCQANTLTCGRGNGFVCCDFSTYFVPFPFFVGGMGMGDNFLLYINGVHFGLPSQLALFCFFLSFVFITAFFLS